MYCMHYSKTAIKPVSASVSVSRSETAWSEGAHPTKGSEKKPVRRRQVQDLKGETLKGSDFGRITGLWGQSR